MLPNFYQISIENFETNLNYFYATNNKIKHSYECLTKFKEYTSDYCSKLSQLFKKGNNFLEDYEVIDSDYIFDNLLYYVNDAIGYRMSPEVVLYYSDNCFGTTDAISFSKNLLRIHDLKTGRLPAHMEQLQIYAALFCLEYGKKPGEIDIELRMYQPENMVTMKPEVDEIVPIMDAIISHDKFLTKIKAEGEVL